MGVAGGAKQQTVKLKGVAVSLLCFLFLRLLLLCALSLPLPLSLPFSFSPIHTTQFSGHKPVRGRGLFSTCICEINADYAAIFMPLNEAANQFQPQKTLRGDEQGGTFVINI